MEADHKKFATNCPFVDVKYLMKSGHQFDMKQHQAQYRDYKMSEENDYNISLPSALSETRSVVTIEGWEDGRVPSETLADKEEAQELIKESREEIKKRRRQELQDNYDIEPFDPVADDLLESQVVHYEVLRRCGLVPVQANSKTGQQELDRSEDSEESRHAPRHGDFRSNLPLPQLLAPNKNSKPFRGQNNISTIGKSGAGVRSPPEETGNYQ
ncbi:hypothetical protein OCU04_011577 [Sclerotinia nivalis]|uniref:Uncharacterized protein n=1 Tax=Sclerotinia nivalis TaxID=352851 RepID=A0A9X0ABT5_9HELO|nr:hypothetical protein OCU04_011577 [Sclerotinia nivalis]